MASLTNRDFYKEQILDIACKGKPFGFDKRTDKLCDCEYMDCTQCLFYTPDAEYCDVQRIKWCNLEYINAEKQ